MTPTSRRPSSTGTSHTRRAAIRSQTWSTGSFTPIVTAGCCAREDAVASVRSSPRTTRGRSRIAMIPCRSLPGSQTGRNATSRLRILPATSIRESLPATRSGSRVITSPATSTGRSTNVAASFIVAVRPAESPRRGRSPPIQWGRERPVPSPGPLTVRRWSPTARRVAGDPRGRCRWSAAGAAAIASRAATSNRPLSGRRQPSLAWARPRAVARSACTGSTGRRFRAGLLAGSRSIGRYSPEHRLLRGGQRPGSVLGSGPGQYIPLVPDQRRLVDPLNALPLGSHRGTPPNPVRSPKNLAGPSTAPDPIGWGMLMGCLSVAGDPRTAATSVETAPGACARKVRVGVMQPTSTVPRSRWSVTFRPICLTVHVRAPRGSRHVLRERGHANPVPAARRGYAWALVSDSPGQRPRGAPLARGRRVG